MIAIISLGILALSAISGMMGLGVAFSAVPFLGLFLASVTNQVQPLSLLLNGVTSMFAAAGFARSGLIDWKKALGLLAVATAFAPVGALLTGLVPAVFIWVVYVAASAYMAYRLFRPTQERPGHEHYWRALAATAPISVVAGFLGVGPGFLLLPVLVMAGFEAKRAAGLTSVAVTLPSVSALVPHLATAIWMPWLTVALLIAGAVGSYFGARMTSLYVPPVRVKQAFGVLIVVTTIFKVVTLLI